MPPSISIREYIRWEPDEASEPTTTIVLTSAKNQFVDIRILKPQDNKGVDDKIGNDILPFTRLDWAFAGTSSSQILTDPSTGISTIHSKWAHWVSDRAKDVSDVVDEGDMFPQADGLRTLERGSMVNPATGRVTKYEESWLDPSPKITNGSEKGERVCAVLRLHDDEHEARGVVVRLGEWCQGVLRVGEAFALERWKWEEGEGWKREVRMGEMWLPCGALMDPVKVVVGGEVRHGEYLWKLEEFEVF